MRSEEIYRYSRLRSVSSGFVCLSDAILPQTQFVYTDTSMSPDIYHLYATLSFLGRWSWPAGTRLERSNTSCGDMLVLFSGQVTVHLSHQTYTVEKGQLLLLHDKHYIVEVASRPADLLLLAYDGSLCENIERLFGNQARYRIPVPVTEPVVRLMQEAVVCMKRTGGERSAAIANTVVRLMTTLYTQSPDELQQNENKQPSWFLTAQHYLETNFQKKLSVEVLAEACGCSTSHFYRLFRTYTGVSPYQYLLRLRIDRARRLLEQEDYSIKYVSYAVGFSAPNHFIRYFKQQTGFTPETYAKLYQKRKL